MTSTCRSKLCKRSNTPPQEPRLGMLPLLDMLLLLLLFLLLLLLLPPAMELPPTRLCPPFRLAGRRRGMRQVRMPNPKRQE